MTSAFIRSLKAMPHATPTARSRVQLLGRTYPMSRHGVRDHWTHKSTRMAPRGGTGWFPRSGMASIARMPRGPNPRSRAASRSTEGVAPETVLRLLTHRRARPGAGYHARAGDARPGLGRIHPLHAGMRAEESHLGPQLHEVDAVRQGIERYGALVLARRRAHAMRAGCELDHEVGTRGGAPDDLAVDGNAELGGSAKG